LAGPVRRRRTPREVAEAAIARSERTGKPIDPRKIGAVAFGYVLHWPATGTVRRRRSGTADDGEGRRRIMCRRGMGSEVGEGAGRSFR